jgi:hypothetical protein
MQLYNGMYFSPEREFVENSLIFSQRRVNGEVRMRLYKGNAYVLGRSSQTEKLYSEEEASMDTLDNFSPMDTTGFIAIQSIRSVLSFFSRFSSTNLVLQAQEIRPAKAGGRCRPEQGPLDRLFQSRASRFAISWRWFVGYVAYLDFPKK